MPDTPWTRGKCAYKALLYMGAGVPVVADDVGVTARAVGDGVGGLIVPAGEDRASAWAERIASLGDAGRRARLGAAGRERVERDYSVAAWAPALAGLILPP
jgi:glycosyltransferase involved in cell wall biosynthesis